MIRGMWIARPHETKCEFQRSPCVHRCFHRLGKEPLDRDAWRSVLTTVQKIAELRNLLFFRTHEEYTHKPEWPRQIAANRTRFLNLAEAARKQDYALTRKQYEAATLGCNACHKEFRPVPVLLKPYDPIIVR
jgi:hypothetical protein